MDNPALEQSLVDLQQAYIQNWVNCEEQDKREEIWASLRGIHEVRPQLQRYLQDAKLDSKVANAHK